MKKRLKINGIIMSVTFVLVAVFPAIFFRQGAKSVTFWDQVAEMFGVACILLGQILRVSSRGFKAENSRNGNALIEAGPYSLVRNPMYLGIFFIGLGVVLMLFRWWALILFTIIFAIRYILLMFEEENKLIALFPEAYPAYCKKVPQRIKPSLRALLYRDISEYLPVKIAWIRKEIGTILAVLLPVLLIESWVDIKSRGINLYLQESTGVFAVIILFLCLIVYLNWRTAKSNEDESSIR